MIPENNIVSHFDSNLIKREIASGISQKLTDEEISIISHIGLPNGVLDFQFTENLCLMSESKIIIGKTASDSNLILDLKSRKIITDDNLFISKSLKNLILQLYTYDRLWKINISQKTFGNYREDSNHKKYAKFLETELLQIDEGLLKNDNGLWLSLIEDIEFGIVG
ncbi:hypothetical protein [Flavobacterium sp. N2038]|uniref:hypothetical protein n=1 Tax=Flavobacterium sp. N2038 TaxID=2986829 RepID=UPI002224E2E1|nr:hypothetical protein [Flavobacterium sp. N2038]